MVGQMLGTKHGDRLISLTLCDTAAYPGPPEVWNERIQAVRTGGMASVVDATIDRWFTEPGQGRHSGEVSKVRIDQASCMGCTLYAQFCPTDRIRLAVPAGANITGG